MSRKEGLYKASQYYILHSRDYRGNTILALIFCILFNGVIYAFDVFPGDQRNDILVLLQWMLMLGISLLFGNSMIVDLTVKDKLSLRLEFILASGLQVKDLVLAYSWQMCYFSMIIPFLLLMTIGFLSIYEFSFLYTFGLFLSTFALVYVVILYFNLLALEQKNLKFFKYLLFASLNLLIFLLGSYSKAFLIFLNAHRIALPIMILAVNGCLVLVFAVLAYLKFSKLTNESVIRQEGTWS
ncbi:hypothetical protein D3H64_01820 [Atopobacter sp. AH10]|uniref:hypothetical protein n=1 Tax=Atopobacter sp. AH10 TaxID=2315861 RepID=UPI000EF218AD|nr:hypothetical protein [Atopobacter sp. AH10]RLK63908.1 hypothetical protein D3H64_01820 [Atopobacter sp. AH10]